MSEHYRQLVGVLMPGLTYKKEMFQHSQNHFKKK